MVSGLPAEFVYMGLPTMELLSSFNREQKLSVPCDHRQKGAPIQNPSLGVLHPPAPDASAWFRRRQMLRLVVVPGPPKSRNEHRTMSASFADLSIARHM